MFRTDLLSIIRSLSTVYTEICYCHASYVDCLLARSGWSILEINTHETIIENEITTTTTVIYNQIIGTITTLLVLYILITLIVVVNIISVSKGPLRHTR